LKSPIPNSPVTQMNPKLAKILDPSIRTEKPTRSEMQLLRDIFIFLDHNHSDRIELPELTHAIRNILDQNVSQVDLEDILAMHGHEEQGVLCFSDLIEIFRSWVLHDRKSQD